MVKTKRILLLLPVAMSVTFLIASFYFSNSNNNAALAKLGGKGKSTVEPSQENFDIGMKRYKSDDVDGAIDSFLQAIYFARNTYQPDAYYWLGVCYFDKKLDSKAIDAFNKHVEQTIKPEPEAHIYLAYIYLRNNRLNEAEKEGNIALTQFGGGHGAKAQNVLGLIMAKEGHLETAEYHFLAALGDQPWRYTEAWMNYAENLMKRKDWAKAVMQLHGIINSKVLLKGVDYQKIYFDIGLCLLAKGDHQGAIDNWHEVLNINPSHADAHLNLAMLLDSENHVSSAIKEYKEFVRLSEDTERIAKVKDCIVILEQKLTPNIVLPQTKPSPYMNEQNAQQEKREAKDKDNLSQPNNDVSGF
jgi:tetratricopeptide (TPR) repeat protein